MGTAAWLGIHWLDLLQSASIAASLLLAAYNLRTGARERKIQSLFALTSAHRDIWSKLYEHPELAEVLSSGAEAEEREATEAERLFVHLLILHLSSSFRARKLGFYFHEEGLRLDIREFFTRPIPRRVWEKSKQFQDGDFVAFVDSSME